MALAHGKRVPLPHWFYRPDGSDGFCGIHGAMHALRVAAHCEEISEDLGLVERERDAAHLAGLWHDIGRTDDRADYYHGAKSAGKIVGLGEHLDLDPGTVELALFAVTHHCGSEEHAERGALYTPDPEATLRVFRVLKDADALDRVRLGDLDESFLRFEVSKWRVERAWELLEKMQ